MPVDGVKVTCLDTEVTLPTSPFGQINPSCGDDVTGFRKILQKNTKQRRKGYIYIAQHFVLTYY